MVQGRPKCFSHKPSSPPPLCPSLGGGGVTWPTPKCCCWSLGPCLQGPCVVRHCHLYPLHFGGTLCIAFCEMEPDSTTICTPGTSTDVHPLHRGTRSGTRRWMLCYFIFRCNFCAPYCACTVVVATSPGELRGDRLPWMGGGGVGMSPWCIVLVCSRQRLLADHHSLPFPWTLSLYRRWYPSATHRPVSFLPPLAYLSLSTSLFFPLVGCANGAPGLSLFHCSVSGPRGGGQLSLPLARCVQAVIPNRR